MINNFQIPTLKEVFDSVKMVFKLIDLIDLTYRQYNNNYLMRHYQNRGITLRDIFIQDMLDWLCFLGWGDRYIDDREVIFINELLNLNLTQRDVFNIIDNLDETIMTKLPVTFAIFMEYQYVSGNNASNDVDMVEVLYSLFLLSGSYFIACDGDIDENEVLAFKTYSNQLRRHINTFDINIMHSLLLEQI